MNATKIVMLGLLLIPFAAAINLGNVYAEKFTVAFLAGAAFAGCEAEDKCLDPSTVTVPVGATVVWVNKDSAGHTVTSGKGGDTDAGSLFDSTTDPTIGFLLKPEATWEHTFDKAGEFPYFCQVHPWNIGKVIVAEEEPMAPTPEPTPEPMPEAIPEVTPSMEGTITVTHEDRSFDVKATLSNGSIMSVDVDPDFTSLILTVEATDDGELMITLPRELIDATSNGEDDTFVVLVNGDEADYEESQTTDTERALAIAVPTGTEEIEIVGTQVVPEFPIAVMAVMGVIVATAIAVSRFKNPLRP